MTDALPPSDSPPAEPAPPQPTLPQPTLPAREQWTSAELLGERTEVLIVHNNEVYRLRRTRQDKLILYK
jgi:hemin uptake protein HemP